MRGRLNFMPGRGVFVIPNQAPYFPCKTKVRVRALRGG
ncbi:unnamed protein product, partial [Ectocarpus sp. 12 AP-2014]